MTKPTKKGVRLIHGGKRHKTTCRETGEPIDPRPYDMLQFPYGIIDMEPTCVCGATLVFDREGPDAWQDGWSTNTVWEARTYVCSCCHKRWRFSVEIMVEPVRP